MSKEQRAKQTLTKSEIYEALKDNTDLQNRYLKPFVDAFFEEICSALERGEAVKLSNFGAFTTRTKNARPGRNPKTGAEVLVTARRVVTFSASANLKEKVEHGCQEQSPERAKSGTGRRFFAD